MSRLFVSLLLVVVVVVVVARKRSNCCCCCCDAWIHHPSSFPARAIPTTRRSTTVRFQQAHRKFAQPNFSSLSTNRSSSTTTATATTTTTASPHKRSHNNNINHNSLLDTHKQRLRTAGRIGTKRYVNPTKLFVGNLSYNVTESLLQEWIVQQLGGVPSSVAIHSTKLVRDWKTSTSKGYGFVEFTEPIYATVCLNKLHNVTWMGRKVSVGQGKKKDQDPIVYIKKNNKDSESDDSQQAQQVRMTPEEQAMLRHLDPDLLEEYLTSGPEDDEELDEELLEDVDDDIDDYEDVEDSAPKQLLPQNNNRAQRRQAERINKKKKPSNKGFGV